MKNLIEKLGKKFDEYHNEQLRIDNNQNPDYYLYMGKASAIGDLLTELEIEMELSREEILRNKIKDVFSEDVDWFFKTIDHNLKLKYLDNYFSKEMAFKDFINATKSVKFTSNEFKKALKAYCQLNSFIFNPRYLQNAGERIIQKIDGKTQEVYYIQTKTNYP